MTRLDFRPFLADARRFLAGFQLPPAADLGDDLRGRFSSRRGGPHDLYGAADAAYALWILGELEARSSAAGRAEWAAHLQRFQDPASGLFDRAFLPGHGAAHATGFAVGALRLLGSGPTHPVRRGEQLFASRESTERWLDRLRWSQVWTGSHAAGVAAAILDAPEGVALPAGWADVLLDALTARVDPATGFWKRAWHDRVLRRPTTLDLGGAAHFWWLYDRLGRPLPHPARVLDGILGLQRPSGLWGSRIFGGAFPHGIDFDALHGLRVAWRDLAGPAREARRTRVEAALARYGRAAHDALCRPDATARLFRTPHKLVGTLDALAELDAASETVLGRRCSEGHPALRSALSRVAWQ